MVAGCTLNVRATLLTVTTCLSAGAGHGRAFIGLDQDQVEPFRRHLRDKGIETTVLHWGAPTLAIRDMARPD
jgi:hypothetical protein